MRFFSIFLAILLGAFAAIADTPPEVGVVRMHHWQGHIHAIDAKWQFYPQRLLEPGQFDTTQTVPIAVSIPFLLSRLPQADASAFGYGTLRLRLVGLPTNYELGFGHERIFSASRIWIDGALVAQNGQVGTRAQDERPVLRTGHYYFHGRDTVEIVVQLSNFVHRKGGIPSMVRLGKAVDMERSRSVNLIVDSFLFGLVVIISFFQLGVFLYRHGNRYSLYFALFGFAMAAYGMLNNEVILTQVWPDAPWWLVMRVNFLATTGRVWLWAAFLHALFPREVHRRFVQYLGYPVLAVTVLILVTPSRIYTYTLPAVIFLSVVAIVYLGFAIVLSALRRKEGSVYTFLGTLSMVVTGINDVLFEFQIIQSYYLLPVGVFLFFVLQSLMLAMHFAKSFNRVEDLTGELRSVNDGLEELVIKRTVEIETQKEEILAQRDEIERQRDIATEHNDLLTHQNREINTSILYALRIQQAALPPIKLLQAAFADTLVLYKPRDIVSGDFYWFKEFEIDERPIHVVAAADCTGHGVSGAFLSILGISLLNGIVPHFYDTTAAQILEQMRREFKQVLRQQEGFRERKDGIDIALCIIDPQQQTVQYAGAYNPLFHIRAGELTEIRAVPNPIGIHHVEQEFENHELTVQPGDCLYIFSDGFVDQLGGPHSSKFTKKQFKTLLLQNADLPMATQREVLNKALLAWSGGHRQIDDVLVMGLRF